MKKVLVIAALVALVASPAMANLVASQSASEPGTAAGVSRDFVVASNPYDGVGTYGSTAQDFGAGYEAYASSVFADFTTASAVQLTGFESVGFETAGLGDGDGANAWIWDGLPWEGGSVLITSTSGTDTLFSTGTIQGVFANENLAAGSYWIQLQAVRDYAGGYGQAYLFQQGPVQGQQDENYNPGGGFGMPDGHQGLTDAGGLPTDVNFILTGVPEPSTLALLGFGALALIRRR